MILTVTPNPSLDVLFRADRLVWDDANRIPLPRRRPGGQGINVARAVRALHPHVSTAACALLGGDTGRDIARILHDEGTPLRAVPIAGETRVFVGVRESATGRSLLLNPGGPAVTESEAQALLDAIERELVQTDREAPGSDAPESDAARGTTPDPGGRTGDQPVGPRNWVVACGSLPPGLPHDYYAEVGRLAHRYGAGFIPDCDGPALAAAAPLADLLVPNDMEAARLAGRPVGSPAEALAAARTLRETGTDRVFITLGGRGAVAVTPAGSWRATVDLPDALAREAGDGSAVGAGDAFLAALLAGEAARPAARLARAVAGGTAVLLGRGSDLVDAGDVERVLPHVIVEDQDP